MGSTLSKQVRKSFIEEKLDFIKRNEKDVIAYLREKLELFTLIIKERITFSDQRQSTFITYLIIYKTAVIYFAQKWENEYKDYFQDISQLSLDEAIERYYLIDTIIHNNETSIGIFIYYLINNEKFGQNNNYISCWHIFIPMLNQMLETKKNLNFINRLKNASKSQARYSIDDIDLMNGLEFEKFIAELFSKMGYESEITKASGDQGIDVIASKNGNKIGIQAKCYSSSVGNKAVQEAVAGKNHYRLDKAIVVTNNFFTDAAQQLAQSNSRILWDRNILKEKN